MAKDATTAAPKAERKKPVRNAPVQKDYPTKLDWLRAMTEYEVAQTTEANKAKVARLDKRIKSKVEAFKALTEELKALRAERAALVPDEATEDSDTAATEDEQPSA